MSLMKLITKTLPFILVRILMYALFVLVSFVVLGIMVGIVFLVVELFNGAGFAFVLIMIATVGGIFGILRFFERYVLYMVKMGHIAVIVELLRTGEIPKGKGMIAHGKDTVVQNFGAANVAFVIDKMVYAAVKQIQRWIMRVGNFFSFVPGAQRIIGIINAIMSVSLNYVDEAIMSYIFLQKSKQADETVWKSASDGVVLYAQSWKGILKTATGAVIFIYLFNIAMFVVFVLPLLFVSNLIASGNEGIGFFLGMIAFAGAGVLTTMLKRGFIDPIVMIAMIRTYQVGIEGQEPKIDLQQKLLGVSNRFKRLFNRSKEEEAKAGLDQPPVAEG